MDKVWIHIDQGYRSWQVLSILPPKYILNLSISLHFPGHHHLLSEQSQKLQILPFPSPLSSLHRCWCEGLILWVESQHSSPQNPFLALYCTEDKNWNLTNSQDLVPAHPPMVDPCPPPGVPVWDALPSALSSYSSHRTDVDPGIPGAGKCLSISQSGTCSQVLWDVAWGPQVLGRETEEVSFPNMTERTTVMVWPWHFLNQILLALAIEKSE